MSSSLSALLSLWKKAQNNNLKKHTPSNTGVCTHLNAVIAKVDRLHWKTFYLKLSREENNHTENPTSLLGSNVVFLLCNFAHLLLLLSTNTSFVSHLHLPSLFFSLDYLSFSFFYPIFHLLCGLHWLWCRFNPAGGSKDQFLIQKMMSSSIWIMGKKLRQTGFIVILWYFRLQMVCLTINTFVSGMSYFYDIDIYNFCFWLFLCFIFIFIVFTFVSLPVYVPYLWAVFQSLPAGPALTTWSCRNLCVQHTYL